MCRCTAIYTDQFGFRFDRDLSQPSQFPVFGIHLRRMIFDFPATLIARLDPPFDVTPANLLRSVGIPLLSACHRRFEFVSLQVAEPSPEVERFEYGETPYTVLSLNGTEHRKSRSTLL